MSKKYLKNEQIRAQKVRVVDQEGKMIGVMELEKAIELAREAGTDLVQITEKVDPPVCKLIDYGKFLYQQKKKAKKQKQKGELKVVRISFRISPHDLETKINKVLELLEEGYKVRIELVLKGREKAFEELGKQRLQEVLEKIKEKREFKIDREIKKEGRGLGVIIVKA